MWLSEAVSEWPLGSGSVSLGDAAGFVLAVSGMYACSHMEEAE